MKCKRLNVDYRFCNDLFAHQRSSRNDVEKIYSLWDIYSHSEIVSYPSLVEGWGNQFLEAVKARLPIIIFEYDVYNRDIGPLGFSTITLGSEIQGRDESGLVTVSQERIKQAAFETIQALQDNAFRKSIIEKNYQIGLRELSITALSKYIKKLLALV